MTFDMHGDQKNDDERAMCPHCGMFKFLTGPKCDACMQGQPVPKPNISDILNGVLAAAGALGNYVLLQYHLNKERHVKNLDWTPMALDENALREKEKAALDYFTEKAKDPAKPFAQTAVEWFNTEVNAS